MRKIPTVYPAFIYYDRPLEHFLKMIPSVSSLNPFTEENFPPTPEEIGKKELEFKLYSFEQRVISPYVINQMKADGYRPATLRNLLAFWMFNPSSLWCGYETGYWRMTAFGSLWTPPYHPFEQSPGINFGTLRMDSNQTGTYDPNNDQRQPVEWEDDWLFLAIKQ